LLLLNIKFVSRSGGTAAGLAIGMKLAGEKMKLHAVGVCDSPDYFYHHINETIKQLKLEHTVGRAEDLLTVYAGQGIGYARSTTEELRFIADVAASTGVILDPVYSGKALFKFSQLLRNQPEVFKKGECVLFLHTGGTFGLYDKSEELLQVIGGDGDAAATARGAGRGGVSKMDVKFPSAS
jgi:D-cysteine desulfhydrase